MEFVHKMQQGAATRRDGFTMIEIMIAVAIIGILAALVGPNVMNYMKRVKVSSTKSTLASFKAALMDYQQDMGHFPNKREGGLEAIVKPPSGKGKEKWDGPYLAGQDELPEDGWGNEFEYHTGAEIKNKTKYKYFEIVSHGKNNEEGGTGEDADLYAGA